MAPTTFQPVIRHTRETGERELVEMHWGMVPYFAKSLAEFKGIATINTQAENLTTSRLWWRPFEQQRCLVPADSLYEWKKLDAKTKQPYSFSMKDGAPFAFAGLWDAWKGPAGGLLQSFTIITTRPNELTKWQVHRQNAVVILHPQDFEESGWMRVDGETPPAHLLRPYPAEEMDVREVHKDVGNAKNNHPELLNSA